VTGDTIFQYGNLSQDIFPLRLYVFPYQTGNPFSLKDNSTVKFMATRKKETRNMLKAIRLWRGYGVETAANLLGWGSNGTITKHEQGNGLTHENMLLYSRAYKVRLSDIVGETDFMETADTTQEDPAPPKSRDAIRRELDEIDQESVRWIRAWLCRQADAPNRLVMLESRASELREQTNKLNNEYDQYAQSAS
jgi:hypothetical protein